MDDSHIFPQGVLVGITLVGMRLEIKLALRSPLPSSIPPDHPSHGIQLLYCFPQETDSFLYAEDLKGSGKDLAS